MLRLSLAGFVIVMAAQSVGQVARLQDGTYTFRTALITGKGRAYEMRISSPFRLWTVKGSEVIGNVRNLVAAVRFEQNGDPELHAWAAGASSRNVLGKMTRGNWAPFWSLSFPSQSIPINGDWSAPVQFLPDRYTGSARFVFLGLRGTDQDRVAVLQMTASTEEKTSFVAIPSRTDGVSIRVEGDLFVSVVDGYLLSGQFKIWLTSTAWLTADVRQVPIDTESLLRLSVLPQKKG